MERISSTVLKYQPENVESMTTLASVWLMQGELDPAIELLLKAERLAPEDAIVVGNIAQAYVRKDDKASAIRYYERLIAIGDEDAKAFAREQIDALGR
jgi:cytochrome c-type biogenesis protein CcmH/NrfG